MVNFTNKLRLFNSTHIKLIIISIAVNFFYYTVFKLNHDFLNYHFRKKKLKKSEWFSFRLLIQELFF